MGKNGICLSNLNLSYFMLPFEVIFPQIEMAAARGAVLSLKYILLQESGYRCERRDCAVGWMTEGSHFDLWKVRVIFLSTHLSRRYYGRQT